MVLRRALLVVLSLLLAVNSLAFNQARSMTHFVPAGQRTPAPEALDLPAKVRAVLLGSTVPRPHSTRTPADVGLAYKTYRIPVEPGLSLEAWVVTPAPAAGAAGVAAAGVAAAGAERVALLFHSYAGAKDELLEVARGFAALGRTSVLVDFRGSGGSDGSRTTLGYDEAADVAAAARWAQVALGDHAPVLYGASMGSAAVLRAVAAGMARPAGVILEAPFDRLASAVAHRVEATGVPLFPTTDLLLLWGSLQSGYNGYRHNPMDYAARVRVPALVLYGGADRRVRPEEISAIYQRLRGPKALEVFPAVGHRVAGALPPGRWLEVLEGFLSQLA